MCAGRYVVHPGVRRQTSPTSATNSLRQTGQQRNTKWLAASASESFGSTGYLPRHRLRLGGFEVASSNTAHMGVPPAQAATWCRRYRLVSERP